MKVLHVVASLGLRHGGVPVSVRELCEGLQKEGLQVLLWSTHRGYDFALDGIADDRLKAAGVKLRYFPVHPWKWLGQQYAYSPFLGEALRQEIPRMDLVHLHGVWQYPTAIAARICRQTKTPYLVSPCGGLDPTGFKRYRLFKWIYGFWVERSSLAAAAALCFTSSLEKNHARLFGLTPPSKVIPCPIRADPFPNLPLGDFRQRHPEVGQRRILLFLGRLHPIKRVDLLAHAFAVLAHRLSDIHLVIAGPEDGGGETVRRIVRRAHLLDRVTFTGLLIESDKWAALRESALFLLPSAHENFGMAALEAMAAGIPILVSPQVGLAEVAEKSGAGMVVEADPAAWASAIEQLLKDPHNLRTRGESGRRLVATEFNSRRIATAMRDLYLSIVQTRGRWNRHA